MKLERIVTFFSTLAIAQCALQIHASNIQLWPANGQKDVSPDSQLRVTFPSTPSIGKSGLIQVYDTANNILVDTLNFSIPFSPSPYGNGSTKANYTDKTRYQTNIVGGMDFYYFPIIIHDNIATINLHNNRLDYNRTYSVTIEPSVFSFSGGQNSTFPGLISNNSWVFSTKPSGPPPGTTTVSVSADGAADFSTVQGALDWAPINPRTRTTILIQDGTYEELIFFQYKSNIVICGTSSNKTRIGYPNNSAFNPPNRQGPSRRPAFSFRGVSDVQLSNFAITNYYRGQAEALLIDGVRVILDNMALNGSGDALTTYGTAYIVDTTLVGDGDTILGYGSVFWKRSTVVTTAGAVSWPRTSQNTHGHVFVDCTIIGKRGDSTFARLPDNTGGVLDNWPYAEVALIGTRTEGVVAQGWGPVQGVPFDSSHVKFWEYGTTDLRGRPVDYGRRLNISRQLAEEPTAYLDPAWVLGGWTPVVVA